MFEIPWSDLLPFIAFGVVVADASVAIRGDMSGFSGDLRRAEGETGTFAQRVRNLLTPKGLLGAGALFGLGQSIPTLIRQALGAAGDAVAAFSELQQTQRTTDEVFGRSAVVIEDWAERAADAAGMSERTVFRSASVMGQTLRNMGFDAEEAAEKVVTLQQRASEMAIAFGTTPERAILAITAAMRGERDTIEKFGVSIKQVDVNSKVAALGLDTSTAAAKKNSEAIAILDLVLEQTAGQADRFAESTGDMAVRLAQLQAKAENLQAGVGERITGWLASMFDDAEQLGVAFEDAGGELDKFSTHFGDQVQTIMRLADENGVSFDVMHQRILNAMDLTGLSFPEVTATFSVEGMDVSDQMEQEFMDAALAAGAGVAAMADQMALGGPVVAAEAGKIAGMLPSEIQARVDEIRQAGIDSVLAFSSGLLDDRQILVDAALGLADDVETGLTTAETIAQVTGEDVVAALQTGLASDDNGIRLMTEGRLAFIIAELNKLGPAGYTAGQELMNQIGYGISNNHGTPTDAARRAAGVIRGVFHHSEPKDPKSPLRGMKESGAQIVDFLSEGMLANLGTASAASRALAGALSPSMAMSGVGVGVAGTGAMALPGGGGPTFVLNVNGVQYKVSSAEEAIETLQGLGVFHEGRL